MNTRLMLTLTVLGVALLGLVAAGQGSGLLAATLPGSMTSQRTTNQAASCLTGNRWAMMSGWGSTGSGMMNGGRMMGGMWGAMGTMGMMGFSAPTAQPITEAEAQQRLVTFAADCGADVHVADVMAFGSTYYAQLVDGTGTGLGEVLVDRFTGAVSPEPGPNMMWNSRWGAGTGGDTRYDQAAAQQLATTFLAGYLPGATVLDGQAFPGYYTFDFGRGQVEAMLSVNAATGDDLGPHLARPGPPRGHLATRNAQRHPRGSVRAIRGRCGKGPDHEHPR